MGVGESLSPPSPLPHAVGEGGGKLRERELALDTGSSLSPSPTAWGRGPGGEGSRTILVCAATRFELDAYPDDETAERRVTGVGIPATLGALPAILAGGRPALLVNIGIAGAYPDTGLEIGDIVLADGEVYGDIGFELPDAPGFRSIAESEFGRDLYAEPLPTVRPAGFVFEPGADAGYRVQRARGCTVNSCTGTDATGLLRRQLFDAGFETMEGAAVAQIGRQAGVPVCEIRAISNIAARRDMRPENIRRALQNLGHYLTACTRK